MGLPKQFQYEAALARKAHTQDLATVESIF
jgi:hypothetical protein